MCIVYSVIDFCILADNNECAQNGGLGTCAQVCTNTPGSFSCSCKPGYTLSGYECNGEECICEQHPVIMLLL